MGRGQEEKLATEKQDGAKKRYFKFQLWRMPYLEAHSQRLRVNNDL